MGHIDSADVRKEGPFAIACGEFGSHAVRPIPRRYHGGATDVAVHGRSPLTTRDRAGWLAQMHRASSCGLVGAGGVELRLKRAQRRCDKA
jgi:hypothetical protein